MKAEPKQVLIWRTDLRNGSGQKVRLGKMAAQLAHASLAAVLNLGSVYRQYSDIDGSLGDVTFHLPLIKTQFIFNGKPDINHQALLQWIEGRFTKICVGVDSEQELVDIINQAKAAGLITSLITDAGLTEFNGIPTITCGCVGPAYPEEVDQFTGHLKLL